VQAQATILQTIANDVNSGNTSLAMPLVDAEVRGTPYGIHTFTAVGTTFTTPLSHGFIARGSNEGDLLMFSVTGGTMYSGLDPKAQYRVLSTPTATTFTIGLMTGGAFGAPVNPGTPGTGTTSVGDIGNNTTNGQNIPGVIATFYNKWETYAANYDNTTFGPSRATLGLAPLKNEWYEGALEPSAPTAAQCLAIGVTLPGDPTGATASAAIASAIIAWKTDPMSSATIQEYYKAFMGMASDQNTFGVMDHSVSPAQLVLMGGGLYGLVSNLSFVSPSKYQTYNGFATFSVP